MQYQVSPELFLEKFLIVSQENWNHLVKNGNLSFPDADFRHFFHVLRYKTDGLFFVSNGKGSFVKTKLEKNKILSICSEIQYFQKEFHFAIFQAIPKRKSLEMLVQKLTEIGIDKIILFFSDYSQRYAINKTRLAEITRTAAMQSRNIFLPEISFCQENLLETNIFENYEYVFWGDFYQKEYLQKRINHEKSFCFINGTEGGWSEKEFSFLQKNFTSIKLTEQVLKVETAAILGVGIVQFLSKTFK